MGDPPEIAGEIPGGIPGGITENHKKYTIYGEKNKKNDQSIRPRETRELSRKGGIDVTGAYALTSLFLSCKSSAGGEL